MHFYLGISKFSKNNIHLIIYSKMGCEKCKQKFVSAQGTHYVGQNISRILNNMIFNCIQFEDRLQKIIFCIIELLREKSG